MESCSCFVFTVPFITFLRGGCLLLRVPSHAYHMFEFVPWDWNALRKTERHLAGRQVYRKFIHLMKANGTITHTAWFWGRHPRSSRHSSFPEAIVRFWNTRGCSQLSPQPYKEPYFFCCSWIWLKKSDQIHSPMSTQTKILAMCKSDVHFWSNIVSKLSMPNLPFFNITVAYSWGIIYTVCMVVSWKWITGCL